MLRAGVERWFEKIGEALRRLERSDPEVATSLPDLRDLVDFRNLLAHGYDIVRDDYEWQYATSNLPDFRTRIAALLEAIDEDIQ